MVRPACRAALAVAVAVGWMSAVAVSAAGAAPASRPSPLDDPPLRLSLRPLWPVDGVRAAFVPVQIRLESRDRFTGDLQLRMVARDVLGGMPTVVEWEEPLDVPALGRWTTWLLLPAGSWQALEAFAGAAGASLTPGGAPRGQADPPVALVLTRAGQGWEWLGQWGPAGDSSRDDEATAPTAPLRVVYLTSPEDAPPWMSAYRAARLVVVAADFPVDRLSAVQQRALVGYVRDGGAMVLPERPPEAWAELGARIQRLATAAAAADPRWPVPRLVRVPMETPHSAREAMSAVAGRLGLAPTHPQPAPGTPALPLATEDALRARLFDALGSSPAPTPPRWAALAALAYAAVVWQWMAGFGRLRTPAWLVAGAVMLLVAGIGAVAGASAFLSRVDRPRALLLVRPAGLTAGWAATGPAQDDPLRVELLMVFPGLLESHWEVRSALDGVALAPGPLLPSDTGPGARGLHVRRLASEVGSPAWAVRPLGEVRPSDGDGQAVAAAPAFAGWRAAFYLDAALGDVLALTSSGRGAVVTASGVVPVAPAAVTAAGRVAFVDAGIASLVGQVQRTGLPLGPTVLRAMLAEALAPAARVGSSGLSLAAAQVVADAVALGPEPTSREQSRPWIVLYVDETSRPVVEARRPGQRWRPVPTAALIVSRVEPAVAGPLEGRSSS
ncbi:hypothetical protein [Geochorda subterranea]|uniref:DUF4350 domain-containing protein n=1 Tax=Geochorda subterranea TaxID=3109564 RepID=A0ABZ1BRL9_9FIRM|nr:hypothetical protein [Limnochorda sp. LNt]WRP15106.1 hypothetical protein VLY81_02720 [Limnochorda sp. LNt]